MSGNNGTSIEEMLAASVPRPDGNGVRPAIAQNVIEASQPKSFPKRNGAERFCFTARLLWRRRWVILSTTTIFVLTAAALSSVIPPRYESTTRLLPAPVSSPINMTMQRLRPELGALAGLTGMPEVSTGGERFVALLKSRVIADRLIQRFDLMKVYKSRLRVNTRAELARRTAIQDDRKTGVITLSVSDGTPERAAQLAQGYTQELERFSIEMNTASAHLQRVFLEGRVKELDGDLSEATARLSKFSTKSGLLDPKEQPIGMIEQATKLEAAIIELKAELSAQEQVYAPEALKAPRARLAELERRLASIHGKNVPPGAAAERDQPSIHNLPVLGATFVDLARQVKLLEGIQMYLSEQLELAKVEEVKQMPTFRVMERAEPPELRVWPKRTLITVSAFAFGLLFSSLFVVLSAAWITMDATHPFKMLILDAQPHAWRKPTA